MEKNDVHRKMRNYPRNEPIAVLKEITQVNQ